MPVLFEGDVHVHYGFVNLHGEDALPPELETRGGQVNGLCGAAVPGALGMVTGLHTGTVPVRVEALDGPPPLDGEWEEVVEVSFRPPGRRCLLSTFDDAHPVELPVDGELRARWSARGMDLARDADTRGPEEPALDAYLLQLWPASPAPDVVLRQTSAAAASWHSVARDTAPPPSPAELAARAVAGQEDRDREAAERETVEELTSWGGRLPSARVLALGWGRWHQLGDDDRALLDALDGLDDDALQEVTAWAARASCVHAGIDALPWVAPTLASLDAGGPLVGPFSDGTAWDHLYIHWGDGGPVTVTETQTISTARTPLAPEAAALDAVLSTAAPDPFSRAVDTVVGAASCHVDLRHWYEQVRRHLDR